MASTCGVVASAIAAYDKAAASQVFGAAHAKVLGPPARDSRSPGIGSTLPIRGHDLSPMRVRMNAGATGGCARLLADGNAVLGLAVWQVPDGARVSCSYSLSSTGRGLRAAR
jgi:hypothetical protein